MKLTLSLLFFLIFTQLNAQVILKKSELPEPIKININKKFPKYSISKIIKKENKSENEIFEIEIQKKHTLYTLLYLDGKLIEKTKSKTFSFEGPKEKKQKGGGYSPPAPNF